MRIFWYCSWMPSEIFWKYCWCLGRSIIIICGVFLWEVFEHDWELPRGTWQIIYFVNITKCLGIGTVFQLWCSRDQGLKFMQMIPVFNCCPESSLEGMPYPEYLLSIPACIPPRAPKSSPLPTIAKKYEWYLDAQATTWELFRILLSLMLLHSIITNSR